MRLDGKKSCLLGLLILRLIGWASVSVWASTLQSLPLSARLQVGDTLVSPSGHFELGVFALPPASGSYYLCIRYAAPIEQTVVWVANRDNAVSNQAYLELVSPNGNLQLSDPNNDVTPVPWASNTANAGVGQALLLDTGNVVLVDGNGKQLWDSFKNSSVTDTLLPGQFLYRADNRNLTSWRTRDIPATGNGTYTFGWGTRANVSILQLAWTSPKQFAQWTGGVYIPGRDDPNPATIPNVDYVFVDTTLGNLYYPSLPANTTILESEASLSNTILKRITLDIDGGLRLWQWTVGSSQEWIAVDNWVVKQRGSECFAIGACGQFGLCNTSNFGFLGLVQCTCPYGFEPIDPNDLSRGCQARVTLGGSDLCDASKLNFTVLPIRICLGGDYRNLTGADSANCQAECLKDCNCFGAVYSHDEQYCWMKTQPLYNLGYPTEKLHGTDRTAIIKISLFQPPPESRHKKGLSPGAIAGIAVGACIVVIILFVGILICCLNEPMRRSLCERCRYCETLCCIPRNRNHGSSVDRFPGDDNPPINTDRSPDDQGVEMTRVQGN